MDNHGQLAHVPVQQGPSVPPFEFVYQLILEQFWGDGVSKREIRSVYTTANDANAACHDYLLRTWPRDQFTLYEIGASPQRPELAKVSAQINGDRFHVWIERHTWEGILDFTSKAIAKRAGKGPNAYILQRTIKDASGGKRRSTTRGIYATRQLAKQALAQDEPPSEWSSNQGYVLEPGGEYAHALSPSGKTAWLFIEVRPLYMNYARLDQEEHQQHNQDVTGTAMDGEPSPSHVGNSAMNPISLDHPEEGTSSSIPPSPSTLLHPNHLGRFSLDNPFSPVPSNPDEAGAFVYLVLQLKTIPYTPPILTVEAVAYVMEVANRFGIALLEGFNGPNILLTPTFRDDGCLQVSTEQRSRDEGLTVWVEKRAVVLGDEAIDFDLVSEHGSIQSNRVEHERDGTSPHPSGHITATAPAHSSNGKGSAQKREEPDDGFEAAGRPIATQTAHYSKAARLSPSVAAAQEHTRKEVVVTGRYKVVAAGTSPVSATTPGSCVDSSDELSTAIVAARMKFYGELAQLDIASLETQDKLDTEDDRSIQARSRAHPSSVLLEMRVEDSQA
ncbi:hypothetical protein K457DRAFT_133175 [Linnemannia elongata AG-77]|uniref:Uncharacterized protein n=1 Tax=Linnemannia elongata AG-77 TaxID=1314771 RepID=A0A197KE98_9FUNG|nr:hypothetical protein K457DRAFT_133175 [Linnemannia elongata AG-77]